MKRGEIVLANLNPKKGLEMGKVRPVVIVQSNLLNAVSHPSSVIIPLSTQLIDDAYPLRYRITARSLLQHDSDAIIDQIRAVDNTRITSNILATLSSEEIAQIDAMIKLVLGLK
ncbi:type II toxin-antitoxin system PemK/MazF family toxin [Sulfuricurvum sp.]|uniref:type II toxin-antitoxin system PemK/MazF family toxin n=1 Tax=Sulfuricurvum sp. TaxID=2025608 RepID=UPI0019ADFF03|nr:type II toxin-antitoxin system PemK/MazF family toxin [Sulfuricurvum sp.]MBD3799306.1 type II toxin-antitoxin system PemK/MazF family toxin [Campylobacterota bacterium]MBD3806861.1 type II toxin-antitoxin system PemK/MazF family toxin [Sulfuricurvum sp.]